MAKNHVIRSLDDWNDYLDADERGYRSPVKSAKPARRKDVVEATLTNVTGFSPSFTGSRHEREWITRYLTPFYRDQLITDVLRVVKGGKEATVYCCRAHPDTGLDLIAAKVYRPKQFRTFKNDAEYRTGRPLLAADGKVMRDKRLLKAVAQKSRAGEAASHVSWLTHEFTTMQTLYEAGADVPRPIALEENALLMEFIGDEDGPAPLLSEVRLSADEARPAFTRLLHNVEILLHHDRIHGDLSAYNVLWWDEQCTMIDFPQVIDAYDNPDAFRFLRRDVERLCAYFRRRGLRVDGGDHLARSMWRRVMGDETYQVRGSRAGW